MERQLLEGPAAITSDPLSQYGQCYILIYLPATLPPKIMNQCILPLNTQPTNPTQPTSCLPRGHYRNVGHYLVLPSPARTLILQESKSLSSWQTFPLETYGEKRCGLMFHIVSPCNNHEYVSINS